MTTCGRLCAVMVSSLPSRCKSALSLDGGHLGLHRLRRSQRGSCEIDAETVAPDRDRVILGEVEVARNFVVLVADVALHGSERHEAGFSDRVVVSRVRGDAQIDLDLRSVGRLELGQAKRSL